MKLPRAHHMSPEELAGQLLMPVIYGKYRSRLSPEMRRIRQMVSRYHVGGFILFYGHPADIRYLTSDLQTVGKVPLIFGADLERGLGSIFDQGTMFPHPLAFGAIRDSEARTAALRNFADITAREAQSVGINLIFAPTLDLADEPQNPIINIRAYHEDPAIVGDIGATIVRSLQERGLAAVAKHFPGHGAATADSHTDLPQLTRSLAELRQRDWLPYVNSLSAGVKGLMVSHLKLDGIDQPASLAPELIDGVLRHEWRYRGVIFTDALDMGAIQKNVSPLQQTIGPIKAGADILLMPQQVPLAHRLLVAEINRDTDFRARAEAAVERIFTLKRWIHRHQPQKSHSQKVFKVVEDPGHLGQAAKTAEMAITLLKKTQKFPLDLPGIRMVNHLIYTDSEMSSQPLAHFGALGQAFFDDFRTFNNPGVDAVADLSISGAHLTIISLYFRTFANHHQNLDWPMVDTALKHLRKLKTPLVVILFGNPWHAAHFEGEFPGDAFLLSYSYVDPSQAAAFKGLISAIDLSGQLPVSPQKTSEKGMICPARDYRLAPAADDTLLKKIRPHFEEAIQDAVFPGAVILVAKQGEILLQEAFGRFDYDKNSPEVSIDTAYDLASLTKVLAGTAACMKLYEQEAISLDQRLSDFYSMATDDLRGKITIADLLGHQSGWPAWLPFYKTVKNRHEMISAILNTPLEYQTGSKSIYSDLGFMMLFDLIEKISGQDFQEFCRTRIFAPLGMHRTDFQTTRQMSMPHPPTGSDDLRSGIIQNEVNDSNCFAMGGISAHAGLFGPAIDVAAFGQLFLSGGIAGGKRIFRKSTIELFCKRWSPEVSERTLGWDTPSSPSSSGRFFSKNSVGHLGFTGTSLWIDREREIIVVLLSNRVHPDREASGIKTFRPKIHDVIMKYLLDK